MRQSLLTLFGSQLTTLRWRSKVKSKDTKLIFQPGLPTCSGFQTLASLASAYKQLRGSVLVGNQQQPCALPLLRLMQLLGWLFLCRLTDVGLGFEEESPALQRCTRHIMRAIPLAPGYRGGADTRADQLGTASCQVAHLSLVSPQWKKSYTARELRDIQSL